MKRISIALMVSIVMVPAVVEIPAVIVTPAVLVISDSIPLLVIRVVEPPTV